MNIEKVVIDGVEYGVKRLTFGEYKELIKLSTKVKNEGGKVITDIDPALYQEKLLYYCLVKPDDYYRNQDKINELDYNTALTLVNKIIEINGLNEKKSK